MRRSVVVGVVLSAFGVPAFAGDDVSQPVQNVQVVPLEAYTGALRPKLLRSAGLVYDGDVPISLFTNTANQAWAIDDVGLVPGNASAISPQLITGIALGFAIRGTIGTRDFDVVVEFLDSYSPTAPANTAAWTTTVGTSFRIAFTGLNQNTAYTTNIIDLTGLPGGGIQLNDSGVGVSIKFFEPGTTTLVSGSAVPVTHLYESAFDPVTLSNMLVNGSNTHPNWRDADADGIMEVTDLRTFAWPAHARFWLQLEGDARCPADFNNDGFVDGIDYDLFNNAFETPC